MSGEVPADHTKPLPESGDALYLVNLILPIMFSDENDFLEVRIVPMVMSRN